MAIPADFTFLCCEGPAMLGSFYSSSQATSHIFCNLWMSCFLPDTTRWQPSTAPGLPLPQSSRRRHHLRSLQLPQKPKTSQECLKSFYSYRHLPELIRRVYSTWCGRFTPRSCQESWGQWLRDVGARCRTNVPLRIPAGADALALA